MTSPQSEDDRLLAVAKQFCPLIPGNTAGCVMKTSTVRLSKCNSANCAVIRELKGALQRLAV